MPVCSSPARDSCPNTACVLSVGNTWLRTCSRGNVGTHTEVDGVTGHTPRPRDAVWECALTLPHPHRAMRLLQQQPGVWHKQIKLPFPAAALCLTDSAVHSKIISPGLLQTAHKKAFWTFVFSKSRSRGLLALSFVWLIFLRGGAKIHTQQNEHAQRVRL